jgi:RimJ/RimL family protein N-acetyltransferase
LHGEILAAIEKDRARLEKFLPWVPLMRIAADEENYLQRAVVQWDEGAVFDYGIFLPETGAYIGNVGVHNISWPDDRCELGYWLTAAAEGQGYMTEAVQLLETELFSMGFHRIEIHCNRLNERSAAVPRRCGYALEGILKENVLEMGKRRDTMIWAKVRV